MTRTNPTDHQCLAAARRALADHLATRPASTTEAASIAAGHRAEAASLLAEAAALEGLRMPAAEHGPTAVADQHLAARTLGVARNEASRIRALALKPTMRAEAWEAIQSDPTTAWEATRREYAARVAYYEGLIAARKAVQS